VFAANGFGFAAWASRIPAIRDEFGLGADRLGLLLTATAIGSMLALPAAGLVVQRFGPRRTVLAAGALACAGVVAIGLTPWIAVAAIGFGVFGAASGMWDVAMNVEGAAVERRLDRDVMSRLHAVWSLGSVVGAGLGAVAARQGVPLRVHLPLAAAAVAAVVLTAPRWFLPDPARPDPARLDRAPDRAPGRLAALRVWREPRTLALGLMVLGLTLAEGSANDWLALALVDDYGAGQAVGALGYAIFVAALLVARLAGPVLLARVGRVAALRGCTLSAVVGLGLFAAGARQDGPVAAALAGVGAICWGAGCALAFPVGLSAAADQPDRAAARVGAVATIGYLAFLSGPPLIGRLAAEVGVSNALIAVTVPVLLALLVTGAARAPEGTPQRGGSPGESRPSG
jgi:cyanate permease